MKKIIIIIISYLLQINGFADEQKPNDAASVLWTDGKITPEQPFKAKVVAAGGISPWSGKIVMYLREDSEKGRLLEVMIGVGIGTGIQFTEITQNSFDETLKQMSKERSYHSCVFFEPVEVSNFVWVTGIGDVGKKLGDNEIVKRVYLESLEKDKQKDTAVPDTSSNPKSK
jgi:hypothetical protein